MRIIRADTSHTDRRFGNAPAPVFGILLAIRLFLCMHTRLEPSLLRLQAAVLQEDQPLHSALHQHWAGDQPLASLQRSEGGVHSAVVLFPQRQALRLVVHRVEEALAQ